MNKKNVLRTILVLVLIVAVAGIGFFSFQAIAGNVSPLQVRLGPSLGGSDAPNNTGGGFRFTFP